MRPKRSISHDDAKPAFHVLEVAVVVAALRLRRLRVPRDLLRRRTPPARLISGYRNDFATPASARASCDARGGDAQVEVVRDGLADQRLQRRVLEDLPPGHVGERLGLCRLARRRCTRAAAGISGRL